jgi:hypothetical protein
MAGKAAARAPPAMAHEIAKGIDFILKIIKPSPSRISFKKQAAIAARLRSALHDGTFDDGLADRYWIQVLS